MELDMLEALRVTTEAISQTIPNDMQEVNGKLHLSRDGKTLSKGISVNADTLDGKHADNFVAAEVFENLVGDIPVTEQISAAINAEELGQFATTEALNAVSENVDDNTDAINNLNTLVGSTTVADQIAAAISAEGLGQFATTEALNIVNNKVEDNTDAIDNLNDLVGNTSVTEQINAAIDAEGLGQFATTEALNITNDNVEGNANAINDLKALVGNTSVADQIAANKPTAAEIGAWGFKRQLTSEDDMDKIREPGSYFYMTSGVPANAPFPNASIVEVIRDVWNEGRILQRGTRYGEAGHTAFRTLHEGKWLTWSKVATVMSKTVTATTNANGNINLGLSDAYCVMSVKSHNTQIAIPYFFEGQGWRANIMSASEFARVPNSEVTVTVYYSTV